MKTATRYLPSILGLMLFAGLTLYEGAGDVAQAFASVGFGVLWIALIRLRPDRSVRLRLARRWFPARARACGFSANCAGCANRSTPCCRWRRSAATFLARDLLRKYDVGGGVAAASVLVDLLAQTATQVVFTLIGVILLLQERHGGRFVVHRGLRPDGHGAGAGRLLARAAGARHGLDRPSCRQRVEKQHRLGFAGGLAGPARRARRRFCTIARRWPAPWPCT